MYCVKEILVIFVIYYLGAFVYRYAAMNIYRKLGLQTAMNGLTRPDTAREDDICINSM